MVAARIALLWMGLSVAGSTVSASFLPFISELHYDNVGRDVSEFVAVTGPGGFTFTGWQVVLYNGADGERYDTQLLQSASRAPGGPVEFHHVFGTLQNGPDAVALISDQGDLVDFVAYEQLVTASEGPAFGTVPRLLPVREDAQTGIGMSLQRVGTLDTWAWVAAPASPGIVNDGLHVAASVVPSTGVMALWVAALGGLGLARRRNAAIG